MSDNVVKIVYAARDPHLLEHLQSGLNDIKADFLASSNKDEIIEYCKQWKDFIGLIVIAHEEDELNAFSLRSEILPFTKEIPFIVITPFITKQVALKTTDYKISKFIKTTASTEELIKIFHEESCSRIEEINDNWEITQGFIEESQELLEEMEDLILELEEHPGHADTIDRICAILHTIKGTGAFLKPDTISQFAHKFEDFLLPIKKKNRTMTKNDISTLLSGLDTIKTLVEKLSSFEKLESTLENLIVIFKTDSKTQDENDSTSSDQNANANKKSNSPTKKQSSIKVDIELLESFMELSGRVTITKKMMDKVIQRIFDEFRRSKNLSILVELIEELHKVNSSMQNIIDDIRKVPLRSVYKPIGRALSDLRRQLKKDIEFEAIGEHLLVDTVIAEVLNNSLIHIVRNCVDHGIESAEERISKGKTPAGHLKLESWITHEDVVVELSDDGRGIALDKVRKKVIENKLFTLEEVDHMTEPQLLMMILHPGFSTATQVTDISGRGVGMDMVKKSVEEKGGKIEIESKPNQGSKFRITLPIPRSVTVINGLMVTVHPHTFFIPQHKLKKLMILDSSRNSSELQRFINTGTIEFNEQLIPVININQFLNSETPSYESLSFKDLEDHEEVSIVVVESCGQSLGLFVNSVGDFEDLIVKFIPPSAKSSDLFSGVTFLDDVRLSLVLDVDFITQKLGLFQQKLKSTSLSPSQKTTTSLESNYDTENLVVLFQSSNHQYACPAKNIVRLGRISKSSMITLSKDEQVTIWNGHTVELLNFRSLFETKSKDLTFVESDHLEPDTYDVIFIKENQKLFGMIVDEISDLNQLKNSIDCSLQDARGLSGSTILHDRVISIVDPGVLLYNFQEAQ